MVGYLLILKTQPSAQPLLVSIPPLVDLSGPPTTFSQAIGLTASSPLTRPLMLAIMSMNQLKDHLMKGAMMAVRKGRLVGQVPLVLVD